MKVHVEGNRASINCPACRSTHTMRVDACGWTFNGDAERPTFSPSLLVKSGCFVRGTQLRPEDGKCHLCEMAKERGKQSYCGICHSFIREGRIEYLSDCTHALAGKTVDLPDWDGIKIAWADEGEKK